MTSPLRPLSGISLEKSDARTIADQFSLHNRRASLLIFAAVLTAAIAVTATNFLMPPTFSSTSIVYITPSMSPNLKQAYRATELANDRTLRAAELVLNDRILKDTLWRAELSGDPDELRQHISVSVQDGVNYLEITATGNTADQAMRMSDGAATALIALVAELDRPSVAIGAVESDIKILQRASDPTGSPTRDQGIELLLAILGGVLIGMSWLQVSRRFKLYNNNQQIAAPSTKDEVLYHPST